MTGTLRNYHSPQFVTCFYTGCLSKDVTGALLSLFFVSFCFHTVCLSKDVTGHCSFCCIALPRSCFTVLLGSALSLLICFWTSSHDSLYSVSVQRRGRCSVSCFILRKTSFCILLHSSGFTVCLSKDVTGALLPTPLTPFCFLLLSPFLRTFLFRLLYSGPFTDLL